MSAKYTEDHEWITLDGETGTVGISTYAAAQLGDVVFVELPEVGRDMDKGDEAAVVESVKAASEIYSPVAGEVIAVNEALETAPETVNAAPEDGGWFVKIKVRDASELDGLMDAEAYAKYCDGL